MTKATTAMKELNETVKIIMANPAATHHQRAAVAAEVIEGFARNEFHIPEHVSLDVPIEWEHHVSGLGEQWQEPDPIIIEPDPIIATPEPLVAEPVDPEKDWFDSVGEEDEAEQTRKFLKWWNRSDRNA